MDISQESIIVPMRRKQEVSGRKVKAESGMSALGMKGYRWMGEKA